MSEAAPAVSSRRGSLCAPAKSAPKGPSRSTRSLAAVESADAVCDYGMNLRILVTGACVSSSRSVSPPPWSPSTPTSNNCGSAKVTIATEVSVPVTTSNPDVAEGEVDREVLARAPGRRFGVDGRPEMIDLGVRVSTGAAIRSAIGCRWFDVVRLTRELDMWVDDEGAIQADAQINLMATAIARAHGAIWQPLCGVVVFRRPTTARSDGGPV